MYQSFLAPFFSKTSTITTVAPTDSGNFAFTDSYEIVHGQNSRQYFSVRALNWQIEIAPNLLQRDRK